VQCTKISPEFAFGGQRSKVKVTRDKKEKCDIFPESSSRAPSCAAVVASAATPVGKSAHADFIPWTLQCTVGVIGPI